MATYAALVSLLNVMDHIQNHPRLSVSLDKNQVQSLCEKINFLLEFIEADSDGVKSGDAVVLEREIACAAYAAEDVIESHVVGQILAESTTTKGHEEVIQEMNPVEETTFSFLGLKNVMKRIKRKVMKFSLTRSVSVLDLQFIIRDIDSVKENCVNVKEQRRSNDVQPPTYRSSSVSTSATPHHDLTTKSNNKMVGFDDELTRLLDELTGQQSARQIIPIVGMGGIGKTTLATTVYEHPFISYKFDVRSWVTISQQYNVREIFSKLLSSQSGETDETDEHELGERLYKNLIGRRYLIVLDDIWSLEAWHKIKRFLPDNNNASRILITTRLSDTASHLGTSLLTLKFLDEAKSWELFCQKAFPLVQVCPPELEEIGKEIAKKCKGLPLSITVIGALVSKSSSMEYWENISRKLNSILELGDESLDILSLSYGHLPAHLKPCFLHMGVFPEDREIRVSRLIQLWASEGFIKPNKTQSLEEIAEGYLKDLIDRNLILVNRWSRLDGKMETCHMHDLLRDLCLRTAQREKFLRVMSFGHDAREGVDEERRFVFHERIPYKYEHVLRDCHGWESSSLTRTLVSVESLPIKFKLLRVLHNDYGDYLWAEIMKQVNLRYICTRIEMDEQDSCRFLSSISLLWNLQTLIVSNYWRPIRAPPEIWEMLQLRHVDIKDLHLPDPPANQVVLRNLQTLKKVTVSGSNHHALVKRIPNVMELEIEYKGLHKYFPDGFGLLHKLESLRLWCSRASFGDDVRQTFTYPSSLQKLTLERCELRWGDLTVIGALPNLKVLRLKVFTVRGSEWSPAEGQFLRLKFLEINGCDLIKWNAESSHFPVLEKLVLYGLRNLNEVPSGIGEIATLGLIDLIDCSDSSAISAMKILAEQESLGYEDLQLRICVSKEANLKRLKEEKVVRQLLEEAFTTTTRLQICQFNSDCIWE